MQKSLIKNYSVNSSLQIFKHSGFMLTNVDMHWLITVNIQWFQVDKRSNASVLCFKYSVVSC